MGVKFCKMIISFLLLFSIQFLSYESRPSIRNDKLSQFEGNEAGYELYHKLDEAAEKAGKLQEKEDTELTERKNAIEKSAFLLQNYRSAFRKHFNPEENFASRVKRMVDEKDKKKDKKSEGEEGDDAENDDAEAEKEKEDKEPAEGDGAENAKGDYTKKNVETAKKHLLESDDLLQQLQGKFSDILKEFGEDPSKLPAAKENENGKEPEEGKAEEDDEKKDDEDNGGDEKKEDDENDGDAKTDEDEGDAKPEDEGDAETEDEDDAKPEGEDEEGLRKGKAKKKGKKASKKKD